MTTLDTGYPVAAIIRFISSPILRLIMTVIEREEFIFAEAGAHAAKLGISAETIVSDYWLQESGRTAPHQATGAKACSRSTKTLYRWIGQFAEGNPRESRDRLFHCPDLQMLPELSKHVCAWKLGSGTSPGTKRSRRWRRRQAVLYRNRRSTMEEVEVAVSAARKHTGDICLMQCNTNYMASLENFKYIALNVLKVYAAAFPDVVLLVGSYAGPCDGTRVAALGARAVEKHFTDDQGRKGRPQILDVSFGLVGNGRTDPSFRRRWAPRRNG